MSFLSGERGIRTPGPHFWSHIISNDAHSATLPSLPAFIDSDT